MSVERQFSHKRVKRHISSNFSKCPEEIRVAVAERVLSKAWTDATLSQAVGIVLSTYARHNCTDYERLLSVPGITREEARMLVAEELKELLASWKTPNPVG